MRRFISRTIRFSLACLFALPAVWADKEPLRIALETDNPPFAFLDEHQHLAGFDADIARAICEVLQRPCELIPRAWDTLLPGLQAREYDLILSSLHITEERQQQFLFSRPYYRHGAKFIRTAEQSGKVSIKKLAHYRVGVASDSAASDYLQDRSDTPEQITAYATVDAATEALRLEKIDLVFGDRLALAKIIATTADLKFTGPSYTHSDYFPAAGIALHLEDETLQQQINQALKTLRARKLYQAINKKYFPFSIYGR